MNFQNKLEKYKDKALNMLEALISYPSVLDKYNPESIAPFGNNLNECLSFVLDYAIKDGFNTFNAANYAGHIEYGSGNEILGILAHLDVVPVNESEWDSNPFKLDIRNNKMYARGIMDDKGPFVASYIALKMLKDEGYISNKRIRLIFGLDEESGSRCIKKYFTLQPEPNLAFSPDAEFPLIHGEKGIISYDILVDDNIIIEFDAGDRYNIVPSEAKMKINLNLDKEFNNYLNDNNYNGKIEDGYYIAYGKATHAMCPENGINAAYILFDFLNKYTDSKLARFVSNYYLFDVNGKKANYYDTDLELGNLTSNFAVVKINNYKGKIGINCRVPKDNDFDLIKSSVEAISKEYGYKYELLSKSNSHYIPKNSDLVTKLMEAYKEATGDMLGEPFTIGGGTYARECKYAVAFGPLFPEREDVCHIANEYMYLDDFYKLIEIYYYAILKLTK